MVFNFSRSVVYLNGQVIDSCRSPIKQSIDYSIGFHSDFLYYKSKKIGLKEILNDTIYEISENCELIPKFIAKKTVDAQGKKGNILLEHLSHAGIMVIFENNQFIILQNHIQKKFIYDKKTNKIQSTKLTYTTSDIKNTHILLEDNINKKTNNLMEYYIRGVSESNHALITTERSLVDPEDNPVVILAYLKKD